MQPQVLCWQVIALVELKVIYSHSGAISTLPTMYGYSTFGTNMSVYYNLRTLTSDDTNGKAKVADIRGF